MEMLWSTLKALLVLAVMGTVEEERFVYGRTIPTVFTNNPRPIVGILSQETPFSLMKYFPWAESFITASYIKYIESAGAQVVPILINRTDDYYEKLLNSLNGILLPGGGVSLETSEYSKVAKKVYDFAVQANDRGDYFPLWGTCLGFEMLTFLMTNKIWLTNCSANDIALPLTLSPDYSKSRLFRDIPKDVYMYLTELNVTANFHRMCITPHNIAQSGLNKVVQILSTNEDVNGVEFVSTFEAYNYPFFGVQWHPEKNAYEWTRKYSNIPHNYESVRIGQHFANVFVEEVRKNHHKFSTEDEEYKYLIFNYRTYELARLHGTFQEAYFFKHDDIKDYVIKKP